jgi:hypothetical protein
MSKLWVFGDSFTEGFNESNYYSKNPLPDWRKKYIEWKGYVPQVFNEILADKLKIETINCGIGGADNYTIFHTIIKNLEKISKDDIVIIGWSSVLRIRVARNNNTFAPITAWMLRLTDDGLRDRGIDVSQKTISELFVNRTSSVYIDEINDLIKVLKLLLKEQKVINWSPFYDNFKWGMNILPIPLLDTIIDETKYKILDGHFCEPSHFALAEYFYDLIIRYNDKKTLL